MLTQIDSGTLYLTSKRIFIDGVRKNTSVQLKNVVHFTIYSDGLQIEKVTGKDLYLQGAADWQIAGACLEQAARRAH